MRLSAIEFANGEKVARPERFELPTLCFEGRCSIQLSYGREGVVYRKFRAITKKFDNRELSWFLLAKADCQRTIMS